jgi:putative DNA methylase
MTDDKRLIEDYLPIEAISKEASREKSVRKGHISTLHLWWARRPLVACRAAVYGALVPASRFAWSNESRKGKRGSGKDLGRAEAEKFIERLCKYPGDAGIIDEAQQHILEAHAERLSQEQGTKITAKDIIEGRAPRPKVLDMFAGGGAIPLEALRLGCETYAVDLNPVAHIIELCTLVYPQKYGNPDTRALGITGPKNANGETTWGGLAEEVRYWGNWVLECVHREIGDLYPLIPDPRAKKRIMLEGAQQGLIEIGVQQKLKVPEGYLIPVAYLWTRTVPCKNRSCNATVPLVRQTWLCKKKGRFVALKIAAPKGEKKVKFKVVEATTEKGIGFDPSELSKKGNATCMFCGTVANTDYVKEIGSTKGYGLEPMAVMAVRPGKTGKVYVDFEASFYPAPSVPGRIEAISRRSGIHPPDEPLEANPRSFDVQRYGFLTWRAAFTERQVATHLSVSAGLRVALEEMRTAMNEGDRIVALYTSTALAFSRLVTQHNAFAFLHTGRETIEGPLGDAKFPMSWDFLEGNIFCGAAASFKNALVWATSVYAMLRGTGLPAVLGRGSATRLPYADGSMDCIVTDPPYYDSVTYSNLSDAFYVWLKRSVGGVHSEHFATVLTPKKNEAIVAAYRHKSDKDAASRAYESLMAESLREAKRVLKSDGIMTVVYAHKTTLGWATLVDAMRSAGFTIMEAWPLDTEMKGGRKKVDRAMLASSIFLTARKRDSKHPGSYETDVRPQLEEIVRERVDTLWKMRISGADLVIAAVGAGLRAFTQFASVEYDNGEEVPSEKFLAEVEGVVLETMLEKIFGVSRSGVAVVDGPSRFYVLWRYTYKAAQLDAGEAIVFTYGQPVELDGQKGLSSGSRALLEKKKSKYRLYDFTERGENEKIGLPNDAGEPAPLIDVLHRILWLMENKPRGLASFLEEVRPDQERLRLVAQALAGPALKGPSDGDSKTLLATTTAEQAALGKLLANWRSLIDSRLQEFRLG